MFEHSQEKFTAGWNYDTLGNKHLALISKSHTIYNPLASGEHRGSIPKLFQSNFCVCCRIYKVSFSDRSIFLYPGGICQIFILLTYSSYMQNLKVAELEKWMHWWLDILLTLWEKICFIKIYSISGLSL